MLIMEPGLAIQEHDGELTKESAGYRRVAAGANDWSADIQYAVKKACRGGAPTYEAAGRRAKRIFTGSS